MQIAELVALASEIAGTEGVDMIEAWNLAVDQLADLMADVATDTRYRPARVVMFDLFSARELMNWTERE